MNERGSIFVGALICLVLGGMLILIGWAMMLEVAA